MIGDPPLLGVVHVTSTSSVSLYQVVTGAYGKAGTYAVKTVRISEKKL
jgi:hypothetical protein